MSKIPFLVETSRVLEILSKQIYDSPFAMARENVQNAFDAVLMRARIDGRAPSQYSIEITVTPRTIEISDQGIGMSEAVLRNNFWRAGSSGKNSDTARAAGVIGTFGIGAMANFGVCERLQVDTREFGSLRGIRTAALRSQLSIGENCITMEPIGEEIDVGTTLKAELGQDVSVDLSALKHYLQPFVRFLRVPVKLNKELLSQQDPRIAVGIAPNWKILGTRRTSIGRFSFDAHVFFEGNQVGVVIEELKIDEGSSVGSLWLRVGGGQLMGLRSRFGLAPIPVSGYYQLGGFADLPFLLPTAGREALTRDSIQEAAQLIPAIELMLTEVLKETELADSLPSFQQYVSQAGNIAWASRVTVQLNQNERRVELGKLRDEHPNVDLHWYSGTDPDIINVFASEDSPLIRISQQHPRRDLQQRYLREVLGLSPVPDAASILEKYKSSELSWDEVTLTLSIARVLKADYLIDDVVIEWVKISHGVPLLTETTGDRLTLQISRSWSAAQALIRVISSSDVADGMTKDFVRVHIYEKIKSFVPSSQRAGLDALQKTLARRRELYRLEADDKGDLEPLLADYLAGRVDFQDVLTAASRVSSGYTQRVSSDAVGSVEKVLHDVVETAVEPQSVQPILVPVPASPILRNETELRERLLTTQRELPQLNNHRMFLALSDRLFQLEREFFMWPHSTQVAWAGRRIVFLFGLAQSAQNLYYDIELRGTRSAGAAGGTPIITTTIVTKNRIFVPIPPQLMDCFKVADDPVEFFVRFDLLGHK